MAHWNYGRRTVVEILNSGQPVEELVIAEGCDPSSIKDILKLADENHVKRRTVSRRELNHLVHGNHQGVAVKIKATELIDFKSFLQNLEITKDTFVCLLDEVQDPHNLGAIIRNAVCFGCAGVIIPKWRSATLSPGVMKASSGAMAHSKVVQISNLNVAIERLKEKGFFIYGADASVEAKPLTDLKLNFPLAIVLGNEQRGVKPILKKACDDLVSIPQKKTVASLNVSAAAAVFFYELSTQQTRKPLS